MQILKRLYCPTLPFENVRTMEKMCQQKKIFQCFIERPLKNLRLYQQLIAHTQVESLRI